MFQELLVKILQVVLQACLVKVLQVFCLRWVARDVGTAVIQKKRAAGWTGETYVACAAKKGM
jgi:hypothetical protein